MMKKQFVISKTYVSIFLGISGLGILHVISLYNYLLFHALAEIFSVVIACGIFMIAWNARQIMENDYLQFAGIAYLFIGGLDFVHTLAYKGMPIFPGYDANLPTQLWIAARYLESLSLLIAPVFLTRKLRTSVSFALYALIFSLLLAAIFSGVFPACFVEGSGLTSFKILSEYLISLILVASIFVLFRKRSEFDANVLKLITASILVTIGSELAFTFYISVYGLSNLIGHVLKIISFYLIYKAIIETGLEQPHNLLFRNLKQHEKALQKAHDDLEKQVEERTAALKKANEALRVKISERKQAKEELQRHHDHLEELVTERTAELIQINEQLQQEITEHKQVEEELRFQNKIVENMAEGVYLVRTSDGVIVYANPTFERMFGYEPGELFEKHVSIINAPTTKTPEETAQEIMQSLHETGYWNGDVYNIKKDGTPFWCHANVSTFEHPRYGQVWVSVHKDITERKRAEEKLNAVWGRLQYLVSSGPAVIYSSQPSDDYHATFISENVLLQLGYEAWEFLEDPTFWVSHIHPEDAPRVLAELPHLFEQGEYVHEYRFLHKDGTYRWMHDRLQFVCDADGNPKEILGSWLDITERKRTEEVLQQLKKAVETMQLGVTVTDLNGKILYVNPADAKMHGYQIEDLPGKDVGIFAPSEHREPMKLNQIREKKTWLRESTNIRKDGNIFPVQLISDVVKDSAGNPIAIVTTCEDITKRKQTEEAVQHAKQTAEAANRAKSEFLANMSHEIRTPMNAILGFTDVLASLVTDEQQKSYLDAVQSSGRDLLTLINDILDLSKIEAGKLELHYEPVKITTIFREIEQMFSLKLSQKQLEFIIDISEDIPESIILDEVRLRQILFNVVGNAVKFTEQGSITLSAYPSPRPSPQRGEGDSSLDLTITIKDTGIGIPSEAQAHIFDTFRQQDNRTTRTYGGTGLGLAITNRLVEMMNGRIALNSEPGKGSRFTITFRDVPITRTIRPPEREQQVDDEDIIFEPATILIVDDIASNRHLVRAYFREMETIHLLEAENGEEALFFAEQFNPDIILMDIRMPVMDGYEATKQIKQHEKLKHIPVIALTAFAMKQDQEKIMDGSGFDGYLVKPVQRAGLFHELARFLRYSTQESVESEAPAARKETEPLSPETLEKLPEIIEHLEHEMMPLWETVRQHEMFNEIEDFACQIKELGERYSLNILEKFGSELLTHVRNFDIDQIEASLETYPKLIEHLRLKIED